MTANWRHSAFLAVFFGAIKIFWRHELTPMLLWHLRVRRFFGVWRQFLQLGANLTLQKNHFFKSPNEFWNFRFGAKNWRQKNSANFFGAKNSANFYFGAKNSANFCGAKNSANLFGAKNSANFLAPKIPPIFWHQKHRQFFGAKNTANKDSVGVYLHMIHNYHMACHLCVTRAKEFR